MKILIGTPAYGYQVTAEYQASVFRMGVALARRRPEIVFESRTVGLALISMNRNILANLVLQDPSYTHLLFVDADMGFKPELIEAMIDFGEPVVGCIPPSRKRNLAGLLEAAGKGEPRDRVVDAGLSYIGTPLLRDGKPILRGDFAQMAEVGTGIMLIRRDVLERLREACPELWSDDPPGRYRGAGLKGVLQLFEPYQAADGLYYGEDVAFCRRWVERCGGELWACWNAEITHVGREQFVGNYAHRLDRP